MNPYSPPHAVVADVPATLVPLRESDYLKAWLSFALSSILAGLVMGALLGGIAGGVLGASGSSVATIRLVSGIVGGGGSLVASYFLFRFFVRLFVVRRLLAARAPGT